MEHARPNSPVKRRIMSKYEDELSINLVVSGDLDRDRISSLIT